MLFPFRWVDQRSLFELERDLSPQAKMKRIISRPAMQGCYKQRFDPLTSSQPVNSFLHLSIKTLLKKRGK